MSDIETKHILRSEHCVVETMEDGKPLGKPIHFRFGATGYYLSIVQVDALIVELSTASKLACDVVAKFHTKEKPTNV